MVSEQGLTSLLGPRFENGLGAWRNNDGTFQGIYRDLAILELTRRLIEQHPDWQIPDMNRLLVESATHASAIERLHRELGPKWRAYHRDVFAGNLAMETVARLQALDRTRRFESDDGSVLVYPSDEVRIRTRLGEEGARIGFPDLPMGDVPVVRGAYTPLCGFNYLQIDPSVDVFGAGARHGLQPRRLAQGRARADRWAP
jgi:CRISPR-associated endonuclease/helicase Cas3